MIRGAKLHITGASMSHDLMTIPTKAMKPGEDAYSIGCVVPANSPGVKIIDTTLRRATRTCGRSRSRPQVHMAERFVIFDDVFVPNERIFLDGAFEQAAVFAHSLGLWERLGGLAAHGGGGRSTGRLCAARGGSQRPGGEGHIKEKISGMLIHATLVRACLEAAIENCQFTSEKRRVPDELYTNAGKYYGAANYKLMVRDLHDISGGSVLTAPSVRRSGKRSRPSCSQVHGHQQRNRRRISDRLFHAIRDLTGGAYGGWKAVTNLQAGGGLYAQRIATAGTTT